MDQRGHFMVGDPATLGNNRFHQQVPPPTSEQLRVIIRHLNDFLNTLSPHETPEAIRSRIVIRDEAIAALRDYEELARIQLIRIELRHRAMLFGDIDMLPPLGGDVDAGARGGPGAGVEYDFPLDPRLAGAGGLPGATLPDSPRSVTVKTEPVVKTEEN